MSTMLARLKHDVEALARPDGRVPGSAGHARARRWLERRLSEHRLATYAGGAFSLPYGPGPAGSPAFANLIGVAPGRDRAAPPVLLGAHYDSVIDAPCADDNAAAVAIALAVAESAVREPLERDLVVALFDAEEPPHFLSGTMGSFRFYEEQQDGRGFHVAVVMDLVGHEPELPGLEQLLVVAGIDSSPSLPEAALRSREEELQVVLARHAAVGDLSDYHAFRLGGTPYLFLTCGRWQHYHAPSDTPDRLAYQKMEHIARYTERLLRDLAASAVERRPAGDTTAPEIRAFETALGPLLPRLLAALRIEALRTRADLDRLAAALKARGL